MKKIQKKAAKNKLDEGGAAEIERAMEEEKLNILASAHHHSNSSINIENASHQISIHIQRYRVYICSCTGAVCLGILVFHCLPTILHGLMGVSPS